MELIGLAATVGSLVCWIMVIIKAFKASTLHGVLSIVICVIYAFVWGWIHADKARIKKVMIIWTICLIVGMATGNITASANFG